jgi:hypothetical protein
MICIMMNVPYEEINIAQLSTKFIGHALLWHMKYQITTLVGLSRTFEDIGHALLKEFQR